MDTAQEPFPVRMFTTVVLVSAAALVGFGAIASRCLDHPRPAQRCIQPQAEAPLVIAAATPPPPATPTQAEPTRKRMRPRVPTQLVKPPSVGLVWEDCKNDPLCGVSFGKER